ncbi:MAG TPA: hypothetical protein VGJ13_05135 [Pseudonocardiaceae bacterium]|jgi:hypothetical protein
MNRNDSHPDPEELVHEHWPLHGPYDAEHTIAAAATISELVRYLNYATSQGAATALPHPADVSSLVGNLQAAVGGLEQTLRQVAYLVEGLGVNPNLRNANNRDDQESARAEAAYAVVCLQDAAGAVNSLYQFLNHAHIPLAALYLQETAPVENGDKVTSPHPEFPLTEAVNATQVAAATADVLAGQMEGCAPAPSQEPECERCRRGTPKQGGRFCEACIDRCHEATELGHTCLVCRAVTL